MLGLKYEDTIFSHLYNDKKKEGKHAFNVAMTGSGKTTLLRSAFLTAPSEHKGDHIFHVHIKPDPDSLRIYRSFNIPIFTSLVDCYNGYWEGLYSHMVYHPRSKLVSGVDPKEEVISILETLLKEKIRIMEDGLYTTSLIYFYIDEAQFLMTNKKIDDRLVDLATEGRKFMMNFFIFSTRAQNLNRSMLSQSVSIVGKLTIDQKYMRELIGEFAEYQPVNEEHKFVMYTTEGNYLITSNKIRLPDLYDYFIDNFYMNTEKIKEKYGMT